MDVLVQHGVNLVIAVQSLGSWLAWPMYLLSVLGNENFFFLVLPLVYWSVDAGVGLRIAFLLATSNYLSSIIKMLFAAPRPYWVSAKVEPLLHEDTFGIPSGHAQNSAALWGMMAAGAQKAGIRWVWVVAVILTLFIGFSRLYLGVHFVHDVIAGWLIGYMILFVFLSILGTCSCLAQNKNPPSTGADCAWRFSHDDWNWILEYGAPGWLRLPSRVDR